MLPKKEHPRKALSVDDPQHMGEQITLAKTVLDGALNSAVTVRDFSKDLYGEIDLVGCMSVLETKRQSLKSGDLSDVEGLLINQALALDMIFTAMAKRAYNNMGKHMVAMDTYMKLALKAQNQSRTTLEALVVMKNPPTVMAKQANITHGPQQVNNTLQSQSSS